MTRAKDISKIVTDADLSGTLDVTGTVTAGGLTVEGSTAPTINIKSTDAVVVADDVVGAITFEESDATGGTGVQAFIKAIANDSGSTYDMSIGVGGNTEAIRIDQSGNVGIGTSSPSADLQVVGNIYESNGNIFTDSTSGVFFAGNGSFTNGVYGVGTNNVAFNTNGSERMRIDSSGTVFINGTTSGVSNGGLNVETTSAGVTTTALSLHNQSGGNDSGVQISHRGKRNTGAQHDYSYIQSVADDVTAGNSSLRFWTSGSASLAERMRIDSSGNVGIGESNPVAKTHIQGSGTSGQVTASLILENSSSGTAGMDITGSAGSSRLRFLYGGGPSTGTNTLNEAINIVLEGSNAGNVGIGTTPISNQRLYVLQNTNNTACQISNSDTAGFTSDALFIYNTRTTSNSTYNHISAFNGSFTNGFIVRDSGNAENTNDSYGPIASDERLKQDIVDCGEQWNDLKNLRIRKFRYRSNPQGHLQIGCIAQEAEQVSPNLISRRVPTKHEILVNPDLGNLVDDLDRPIEDEEGNITGYEQKVETDTEVLSFKSSVLFWKATKALQEAMTRIEALETANTALEARIVALETA